MGKHLHQIHLLLFSFDQALHFHQAVAAFLIKHGSKARVTFPKHICFKREIHGLIFMSSPFCCWEINVGHRIHHLLYIAISSSWSWSWSRGGGARDALDVVMQEGVFGVGVPALSPRVLPSLGSIPVVLYGILSSSWQPPSNLRPPISYFFMCLNQYSIFFFAPWILLQISQ